MMSKAESLHLLLKDTIESRVLLYLAGFTGLFAGLVLVLSNNVWLLEWRRGIIVTGLVTIIRVLAIFFHPQRIISRKFKTLAHQDFFIGVAVFDCVIGLMLICLGCLV